MHYLEPKFIDFPSSFSRVKVAQGIFKAHHLAEEEKRARKS